MATSTGRGDWPFLSTWLGDAKPWNLQTAAADGPDQTIWSDWFLDAAAGGGTEALSGIATLALTASGNLTSVTSLSGTATLALTASGALLSTTALSGTATLAITASGELVSTTALSGTATLALAASGELNSTTALSGTASLALDASGELNSTTSLGGEATLALTASGDLTVDEALTPAVITGGAWVPEKARKAEQRRKKRLEDEERELESTIRLAYQRLTGKITTPPAIVEAEGSPRKLAVNAEKLAAQLVSKSRKSEKMRARNAEIIKDLLHQANEITRLAEAEADEMQMEEEAIVMLMLQ